MKLFKLIFSCSIILFQTANAQTTPSAIESIKIGPHELSLNLNVSRVFDEVRRIGGPLSDTIDRILAKVPKGTHPGLSLAYSNSEGGPRGYQLTGLSMKNLKFLVDVNRPLGGVQEIKITIPKTSLSPADIEQIIGAAKASPGGGTWKAQAVKVIGTIGLGLIGADKANAASSSPTEASILHVDNSSPNTAIYQKAMAKIPFQELVGVMGPRFTKPVTNTGAK